MKQATCAYCAQSFTFTGRPQKFCSHACYSLNKRKRIACVCEHCRAAFEATPAMLRKGPVRFCSRDCYYKSNPQGGDKNYRWKGGARTVICDRCASEFKRPLTWPKDGGHTFCSGACHGAFLKENPEQTPNWKGGVAVIHGGIRKHWTYIEWRKAVLRKDNYTCQKCGKRGGRLAAHHLYKFADYPHLRLSIDNGHALCRECHAAIKGKEYEYLASIGLSPLQPPLF